MPSLFIKAQLSKLRPEQTFLIAQGAMAAVAVTPFGIWRLLNGYLLQGFLDLCIVTMMIGFALLGTRTNNFRLVSILFALSYTVGQIVVTALVGPETIYWAFPAQIAVFFVLRSHDAFTIAIFGLIFNSLLAYHSIPLFQTMNFVVTDLLVCVFAFIFSRRLTTDNQRLFKESTVDPLTGAGNRRSFDDRMAEIPVKKKDLLFSLLIIDIDRFKAVNDKLGHSTGDICLQRVSTHINSLLGKNQSLFRYGGEEFVVLAETGHGQALGLAERIRKHIEQTQIIRGRMITVSIGVATFQEGSTARDLLHQADEALYLAKRTGRNKVCSNGEIATAATIMTPWENTTA